MPAASSRGGTTTVRQGDQRRQPVARLQPALGLAAYRRSRRPGEPTRHRLHILSVDRRRRRTTRRATMPPLRERCHERPTAEVRQRGMSPGCPCAARASASPCPGATVSATTRIDPPRLPSRRTCAALADGGRQGIALARHDGCRQRAGHRRDDLVVGSRRQDEMGRTGIGDQPYRHAVARLQEIADLLARPIEPGRCQVGRHHRGCDLEDNHRGRRLIGEGRRHEPPGRTDDGRRSRRPSRATGSRAERSARAPPPPTTRYFSSSGSIALRHRRVVSADWRASHHSPNAGTISSIAQGRNR